MSNDVLPKMKTKIKEQKKLQKNLNKKKIYISNSYSVKQL